MSSENWPRRITTLPDEPEGILANPTPALGDESIRFHPSPFAEISPSMASAVLPDVGIGVRGYCPRSVHAVWELRWASREDAKCYGSNGLLVGALDPNEQVLLSRIEGLGELRRIVAQSSMMLDQVYDD